MGGQTHSRSMYDDVDNAAPTETAKEQKAETTEAPQSNAEGTTSKEED